MQKEYDLTKPDDRLELLTAFIAKYRDKLTYAKISSMSCYSVDSVRSWFRTNPNDRIDISERAIKLFLKAAEEEGMSI